MIRGQDSKMLLSLLVREKGANDPHVIRGVLTFLTELEHTGNNVIIKTDQKSPVRAVAAKIAAEREEGRTILLNSPVKSFESSVKESEYQVRTMNEERAGQAKWDPREGRLEHPSIDDRIVVSAADQIRGG